MTDKIKARVDALADRLRATNISAAELPALIDRAFDLVETVLSVSADGRVTFSEIAEILASIQRLRTAVALARKD